MIKLDPIVWPDDLSDRVRRLNNYLIAVQSARYVLCWVQQALRAYDNPLIDAAIAVGNQTGLPVLVYHGLRHDYPHASDRLHRFIVGASRDLQRGCVKRGLRCVTYVDRPGQVEKGLVYRLAAQAAAVLTDDQPIFVASQQAARFASRCNVAVYAVDAARLVPTRMLPATLRTTKAFRAASGELRPHYEGKFGDLHPKQPAYQGPVCFEDHRLADATDVQLDTITSQCTIDHTLPASPEFVATREAAVNQLENFVANHLAVYADSRNNPADQGSGSRLSPYLHFGVIGPREISRAVRNADVPARGKWKFLDELLTWREWFHYLATHTHAFDKYDALPKSARATLEAHAADRRPAIYSLDDLTHGRTDDQTWNAAQRQWLVTGYMHNNLRMYWGKQIIKWTPDPRTAWSTACYINDRLAFDGRDPSTYGNMQWVFGRSKPGWKELPIFGWVAPKSDVTIIKRPGMIDWIRSWSQVETCQIIVPVNSAISIHNSETST